MLDLLIVLAFVVYAVGSGFRARKKASEGLDEYFLAGHSISGWKAGLSMAATQFAADTPLLVTGLIATGGIFLLWRLWIYGLAFLLMAFVFAIGWRRAGVLTDAELTEVRYSGRGVLTLRVLKAVYYGTVINCVVMAMVLVAAVRIAEVFLPWHEWLPGGLYDPVVAFVSSTGLALGSERARARPGRGDGEQPALDPPHPRLHRALLHDGRPPRRDRHRRDAVRPRDGRDGGLRVGRGARGRRARRADRPGRGALRAGAGGDRCSRSGRRT